MEVKAISAAGLADFLRGGAAFLGSNKEAVNALNVFPVPDGDTGINMFLTINSAAGNIKETSSVKQLALDFSMGALMGARGNSGVILSQIFRGFAQGLPADKSEIDAEDLAIAFQKGVDLSYKSVMKPTEGTILTVFKMFAHAAQEKAMETDDIIEVLSYALIKGNEALQNTPNQLPVLKEAGVVDAGGQGLLYVMQGGLKVLCGEQVDLDVLMQKNQKAASTKPAINTSAKTAAGKADASNVEFIYCTEFLIKGKKLNVDTVKRSVLASTKGDCLLVVGSNNVIKVHYHNNNPGKVLAAAVVFGSLHDLKIENMLDQHTELSEETAPEIKPEKKAPSAKCGVVAVCTGDGLAEIFKQMGAEVLQGGQTMNPSAEDILKIVEDMDSEETVILPNNSNIILTANQIQALTDKKIKVVGTKFITQGIAAMIDFDKDLSADKNGENMEAAFSGLHSGEITYAIRDSKYAGMEIAANDILALAEGKIVDHGKDMLQMLSALIDNMLSGEDKDDLSLISLFYGNGLTEADINPLSEALSEKYPEMDFDIHPGGQPLYYFLVSVE